MPAKSKAQQRFFGMVDAYKKGEMPNASKSIKDAAESMSSKEVKKFAKTKHKGLPNHVKKHKLNEEYMSYEEELMDLVNNCQSYLSDMLQNSRNGDIKDTCIYLANQWGKKPQMVYNDMVNAFRKKENNTLNEGKQMSVINDAIYIVSDGTSAYDVYGCDIDFNEEEILKGPFSDTPKNWEKIESLVEKFNDKINGTQMFRENKIRITESQLRDIIKESVMGYLDEMAADGEMDEEERLERQRAQSPVGKLLKKIADSDAVDGWYGGDAGGDEEYKINTAKAVYYDYLSRGESGADIKMLYYDLLNYDFITVDEQKQCIDIERSNHPDIARNMQKLINLLGLEVRYTY